MNDQTVYYDEEYRPGALATLCAMQSTYYACEWGLDHKYEAVVSAGMSEFLLRYNPQTDLILLASRENEVMGGIVIDGGDEGEPSARLRWYIVSEELRGSGVGRLLIKRAMDFVRKQKYKNVFLTTFDGLTTARGLYEKSGFHLVDEKISSTWGKPVKEQRFEFVSKMTGK